MKGVWVHMWFEDTSLQKLALHEATKKQKTNFILIADKLIRQTGKWQVRQQTG